jgi:hypothetical protein
MDTIVKGCCIEHEALMGEEYGNTNSRGRNRQGHAAVPNTVFSAELEEEINNLGPLQSAAFPRCP